MCYTHEWTSASQHLSVSVLFIVRLLCDWRRSGPIIILTLVLTILLLTVGNCIPSGIKRNNSNEWWCVVRRSTCSIWCTMRRRRAMSPRTLSFCWRCWHRSLRLHASTSPTRSVSIRRNWCRRVYVRFLFRLCDYRTAKNVFENVDDQDVVDVMKNAYFYHRL